MLNDEKIFSQFLQSIKGEKIWQKILKTASIPFKVLDEFSAWKLSGNPSMIRKYFAFARQARGCERIVEKTPIHLLNHRRITHTFPQASILIIFRHPIDVYSSYRKRLQEHPEMDWLKLRVDEFTERYRTYAEAAEELRDSPQAYLLRYEDFVNSPEDSFRKICEFLHEPFEEEPIKEDEPSLKIEGINPNLSKKIQEKTKNWADYISADEARTIEAELKDVMEKYNYESVLQDA